MSWVVLVALACIFPLAIPAVAVDESPAAITESPELASSSKTDTGGQEILQDDPDPATDDSKTRHAGADLQLVQIVLRVFPVAGPTSFTDSWGAPRSGGRTHKGTDIFATKGTPVVAVAPGRVIGAGVSDGTAGIYVRIQHEEGSVSVYLHLNNDTPGTDDGAVVGIADGIAEGAIVAAGTIIGYVGDSGNAEGTPPHLHFEYRPDGVNAVNPFPLLQVVQGVVAQEGISVEALPYTGYESTPMPGAGSLLLVAGMLILLVSRRLPRDYIRRSGVSSITCSARWSGIPRPGEVQHVDHLQRLAERLRSGAPDTV